MMKKSIRTFLAASVAAGLLFGAVQPVDAAKKAKQPKVETQAEQPAKDAKAPAELPYTYKSQEYGYTIQCPKKPQVIPVSALYEDRQGEVLIFDNEEYNIKNAWVIVKDAFTDQSVPDLNKISDEEAGKLLQGIMRSNGYEAIELVPVNDHNKGIYAITAKVVEIDTDGDGQPDTTAEANSQMAVTFFRGEDGERYRIDLIDNPELRDDAVDLYQKAVTTFKTSKR